MEITFTEGGVEVEWVFNKILLAVYYIAFIWVSYGCFQECQLDRHWWMVPDIFNGILGGIVFVYPFNIFRFGLDIVSKWFKWFCICMFFFWITAVIGGLFGIGGMR
jgi:hypothetical protein